MEAYPNPHLIETKLQSSLEENRTLFEQLLHVPENQDIVVRAFDIGAVAGCLFFMDGMAGSRFIGEQILRPCRQSVIPDEVAESERAQYLVDHVLNIAAVELDARLGELTLQLLNGKTVLLIDGCPQAILLETRDYEKRSVSKPNAESVVIGAQQGFVENLRTNITLIRRIVHSPMLISEMHSVGTQFPTNVAILYLKGAANERVLAEVRRRLSGLDVSLVPDSGHLGQLIEQRPYMLLPQTLQTERPDRAAYLIGEGRIAIMMDNSPYALIVPVSLFDLLQTADDVFVRWQYALFNQVVRLLGLLASLLLPALYVALTLYHSQMIPIVLLSSIAETRADVPFAVIVEMLIMEFAFYLVNEAGTRMPSQIGPALGIVGALILGQAAVAANIISPILIIIAAMAGLGNYAIPDYGLGLAIQIMRLGLLFCGAILGLYGIAGCLFLYVCLLCSAQSFGEPYMVPAAPWRPHSADMLLKVPFWRANEMPYFVSGQSWLRRSPLGKKMRVWEDPKK